MSWTLAEGRGKGATKYRRQPAWLIAALRNARYQEHVAASICFAGQRRRGKCHGGDNDFVNGELRQTHAFEAVAGSLAYFGGPTLRCQSYEKIVCAERGRLLAGRP